MNVAVLFNIVEIIENKGDLESVGVWDPCEEG